MKKEHLEPNIPIQSMTVAPSRVALFVPPIQWKGDPAGHIGQLDTFFWVLSGECYMTIEQESFLVKAGQMAFMPKGKMRTYSSLSEDLVLYEMNFEAVIDGENWYTRLRMPFENYVIDVEDVDTVSKWFETSLRHEVNKNAVYDLVWCSNLMNILTTYVVERTRRDKRVLPFRDVIRHMDKQVYGSVTVEELARLACMQPTYFIRRFKAAFGATPIAYFNKLKVYKAMTLLLSTDDSFQKIAASLGLTDAAYFSRMFRKYCNISPTKYRQLFQNREYES